MPGTLTSLTFHLVRPIYSFSLFLVPVLPVAQLPDVRLLVEQTAQAGQLDCVLSQVDDCEIQSPACGFPVGVGFHLPAVVLRSPA